MRRIPCTLTALLLLAACGGGPSQTATDYETYNTCLNECPEEEDQVTCTDSCLLTLAQEQNDEHFCDQITTDSLRSSCLIDIAIVTEDPTLCASVESSNFCYITLAGILEDDTICDNIDSEFVVETCKKNVTEGAEFELREPTE